MGHKVTSIFKYMRGIFKRKSKLSSVRVFDLHKSKRVVDLLRKNSTEIDALKKRMDQLEADYLRLKEAYGESHKPKFKDEG